jgi:hypothetical protein
MTTSPASFDNSALRARVAANLYDVRARIAATGVDPATIRVVAVTKTFDASHVDVAAALGLTSVGENYVDELCAKRPLVTADVRWHYLGALQSNKIARALQCADVLCGVSRAKEILKIARLRPAATIDVQVDFTSFATRNGADPRDVPTLVALAREEGLEVRALMTVAQPLPEAAAIAFTATSALADELGVRERSMGMSDDLEAACRAGSTEVRLGRALFGPRVNA